MNNHAPELLRDRTLRAAGSIASVGVALSYFAASLFAVLMPPELQGRPGISPHEFWTVLSQHPTAHICFHWAWIIAGLFGIGAVPAISLLVWKVNPGAVLWSGLVALLGFAINARSHLMEVAWDQKVIPLYQDADPAFQQAVHVVAGLALDVPDGVLTYGAVGVWILVVNVFASTMSFPRLFTFLGYASAVSLVAGMTGYFLQTHVLLVFSFGVGGFVLVPAWFIWAGILIHRHVVPSD